ncbi:MAG: hypothetical protein LRY61_11560 [Burkholderiaceae bacterium]|nr:hypothetical protein [Burkholderiaceae bacterium]
MYRLNILLASSLLSVGLATQAQPLSVLAQNRSEPVLCAEKDNVELTFSSNEVRRFEIQAIHPVYVNMIVVDRDAPDFTACDMSQDPVFAADEPKKVTFYESADLWITGFTFASFWRPNDVPVKIGNKVTEGLHMLQVWVRHGERAEEVLVLYPPDGYWRARPLAFADKRWTAYGSSFLVGPVQMQGRPVVALESVEFIPERREFVMNYRAGGQGKLRVDALDREHIRLQAEVQAIPSDVPFASLRSMYVTRNNADVADIAWRTAGAVGWQEQNVMQFKSADVLELWAGRYVPSRHNLSAPDMVFGKFEK